MQIINHYLALKRAYPKAELGESVAVPLGELAGLLYCSERNVKFIVKKLQELEWIRWMPGRGRGNSSRLAFLKSAGDLVLEEGIELAKRGQLQDALNWLREHQETEDVHPRFMDWLSKYLGYESKADNPGKQDVLRVPMPQKPVNLDPAELVFALDCHLVRHVFDTLVGYDREADRIVPHLAHHWEKDADGLGYTFYLRKGVLFHHGRELVAADVKYSIERLSAKKTNNSWLVSGVESVRTIDDHLVQIRLKEENHLFLHFLCFPPLSILPAELLERSGDKMLPLAIGTGPFRLTRKDSALIELRAHEGYFRERSHLDVVELWFVPEDAYERPGMQWDRLIINHHSATVPSGQWRAIKDLERGSEILAFNLRKPGIVQSEAFRKAFLRLVNRERMLEELGGNRAVVANSLVPGGPCEQDESKERVSEAEALAALAESGYQGEVLLLSVSHWYMEDAEWIARSLRPYGIRIEPVPKGGGVQAGCGFADADIYLSCWIVDDPLELSWVETLKHISVTYFDETFRRLVEQSVKDVLKQPDRESRIAGLTSLEQLFVRRGAISFLHHKTLMTAYHPSLHGVTMNALGWVDFRNLWFRDEVS